MKHMIRRKKLVALLVAACMAAPLLFAAGGSEGASSSGAGSSSGSGSSGGLADYARVDGKQYTFTIAPFNVGPIEQDGAIIRYFEEMFDVDFDIWYLEWSRYSELMGVRVASGEIPDVMAPAGGIEQWVRQGVLAALPEDVLKAYAPRMYSSNLALEPNFLKPATIDGKIYAVTTVPRAGHLRYSPSLWRGDWLDTLGITDAPETIEEYEDAFLKITQDDPDGNGVDDTYGISRSGFEVIYGAYGVHPSYWFKDGENSLIAGAVSPRLKEALALLADWYQKGIVDPEFITGENTGGYWAISHAFFNGRIGFTAHAGWSGWYPPIGGSSGGAVYEELYKLDPDMAESLVHGLPPVGPYGDRGSYVGGQSNRIVANINTLFGVQLETEKDRFGTILSILDEICNRDYRTHLTRQWGFEGEHWTMNDDETISRTADNATVQALGGIQTLRLNTNTEFSTKEYGPPIKWAEDHGFTVGVSKQEFFVGLPSAGKYQAELNKIRDEMIVSIITGDRPIEYFDEYVEDWYDAGGRVLTEEATEWYRDFWGL